MPGLESPILALRSEKELMASPIEFATGLLRSMADIDSMAAAMVTIVRRASKFEARSFRWETFKADMSLPEGTPRSKIKETLRNEGPSSQSIRRVEY